jgi:hypothetical protein
MLFVFFKVLKRAAPFFLVKKGPKRQAEKILPRSGPLPVARVFRQAFALFLWLTLRLVFLL